MKMFFWLELVATPVVAALWIVGGVQGDWLNDWLVALVVLLVLLMLSSGLARALAGAFGVSARVSKEFHRRADRHRHGDWYQRGPGCP